MLTVLFLSCRRIHLLRETMMAIRAHFETTEPEVQPRYACFDNGSSAGDRAILNSMEFDTLILSKKNVGIGPAMNHLVAGIRTRYFLNLQDDWLLENSNGLQFVRESMQVLESDRRFAHFKLDSCHFLDFHNREVYDGPLRIRGHSTSFYVQSPRMLWGGFCFPPAISRTDAIRDVGQFCEDQPFRRGWAESEFGARFAQKYLAIKSPEMLLFEHIGEEASSGWGDAP